MRKWPFLVFFVPLIWSCGHPVPKDKRSLIAYIKDPGNGLIGTQEMGKLKVTLMYRPGPLFFSAGRPDTTLRFVLSLSSENKEVLRQLPFDAYSEMVQVLSFRMSERVSLLKEDGSVVDPVSCVFQPSYGMSTANNVLLIFPAGGLENTGGITIRIKEFGLRTGDLAFDFKTRDIRKLSGL